MRGPNWRGLGKSKVPTVTAVREARPEDLDYLRSMPRLGPAAVKRITKLKEWHHTLALLFASGYTNAEVAAESGRSQASISNFRNDPMMEELVAAYRPQVQARRVDLEARRLAMKAQAAVMAEEQRLQRLREAEDGGEPVPMRELNEIIKDHDRKFGPVELKAQLNITSFESKMAQGWEERMKRARARRHVVEEPRRAVEEATIITVEPIPASAPQLAKPGPINRRI